MSKKAPPSALSNSAERAQIDTSGENQEMKGPGLIRPVDAYVERESEFPEKLSVRSEKPLTTEKGPAEQKNTDQEKKLQTPEKNADAAPTAIAPKQVWS